MPKTIPIDTLKTNERNPRKIAPARLELLKQSITEFEKMLVLRPIVVDEANVCLGGNMRLAALKALGYTDLPAAWIKRADDLTADEKRQFIIKDNADFGDWDFEILAEDWNDVEDLAAWGLDLPKGFGDDPELIDAEPQTDKAAELNKKWKVAPGDLWQIGEHRLLCGDSTNAADVGRLMQGDRAELLFTSPPYSDQRDYNGADLNISHLIAFIPAFAGSVANIVINLGLKRKDGEIVEYWQEYINAAKSAGFKFLSWNVWDKKECGSIANQSAMFGIRHEWLFVFGEYKKLNRTVPTNSPGRLTNERGNRQADGTIKRTPRGIVGQYKQLETVIEQTAEKGRNLIGDHPAIFPIGLPAAYIDAMTNKNDIVADPFAGSGTTLVACQNLNRKCYAVEISANYCAVILERMKAAFPDLIIKKSTVIKQ